MDIENTQITSLQKRRDRMLKKAKKTQEIEHYAKVKELNKEIKLVVKKEKKRLVKNKLKNSSPQGF